MIESVFFMHRNIKLEIIIEMDEMFAIEKLELESK